MSSTNSSDSSRSGAGTAPTTGAPNPPIPGGEIVTAGTGTGKTAGASAFAAFEAAGSNATDASNAAVAPVVAVWIAAWLGSTSRSQGFEFRGLTALTALTNAAGGVAPARAGPLAYS